MNNTPFEVDALRPYDYLLMGRLQAAELMLVKLANLVGEAVPSIKQAVAQITAEASAGHTTGEENAAALYLHQVIDPIKVAEGKVLSLAEIYAESDAAVKYIDELMAQYLLPSGLTSAMGHIPHPLALPADTYLAAWKKPVELQTRQVHEILEAVLRQKVIAPFLTAAFHPNGQSVEPVFILPNQGPHAVLIAPHRHTWTIVTFPSGLDAMFEHRQARVLNLTKLKGQLREIFINAQPPKVRAMQRPVDDHDTKIQVLLSEIFEAGQEKVIDHRTDQYRFQVRVSVHPGFKERAVTLDARSVHHGGPLSVSASIFQANPKMIFSVLNNQALPVELKSLPASSKAMLVDTLAALARTNKPRKKAAVSKSAASKKKAVTKKTVKKAK